MIPNKIWYVVLLYYKFDPPPPPNHGSALAINCFVELRIIKGIEVAHTYQ